MDDRNGGDFGHHVLAADPRTSQLYQDIGRGYSSARRPDPYINAKIQAAIGDGVRVTNVGAGTGNYEPTEGYVVAVEPSWEMINQRHSGTAGVLRALAEQLPFSSRSMDVALATFTLHHWQNISLGLAELKRVARRQVILMSDPDVGRHFWLVDYFPEMVDLASGRGAPSVEPISAHLGVVQSRVLEVPANCIDGFCGAYWSRPEAYLDTSVRASISSLAQLPNEVIQRGVAKLAADLTSGRWDDRHGHLRTLKAYDLGYR